MAFPDGWQYRVPLTISSTYVDSLLSDFTVIVHEDMLPAAVWSDALDGGGDLRFSSDESGSTQLACDVRIFDTTSEVCDVAVNVPSIASGTDTTIYMWFGKAGESQPSASDTYGQHNAYDSNYVGVWPLNENPSGTAPQMSDRTSNGNHGASVGSMTSGDSVVGPVGNALDFDGSDDFLSIGTDASLAMGTGDFSVSGFFKTSASSGYIYSRGRAYTGGKRYAFLVSSGGNLAGSIDDNTTVINIFSSSTYTDNQWHHGAFVRNSDTLYLYGDGTSDATPVTGANSLGSINEGAARIAAVQDARDSSISDHFTSLLDELRISNSARSAAWVKAEYNNLLNPASFISAGSITDLTATSSFPFALYYGGGLTV